MQWRWLNLLVVLGVGVGAMTSFSGCAEQATVEPATESTPEASAEVETSKDLGEAGLGMESGSTLGGDLGASGAAESGSTLGEDLGTSGDGESGTAPGQEP